MSQGFKLRFDQMREGNPTTPATDDISNVGGELPPHPSGDKAQKLSIIWPDGKRKFLKYGFLLSGDFDPGKESNEILLEYSHCQVLIKGYTLESLFVSLEEELCRLITVIDPRYADAAEIPVVTEIEIETKE